MGLLQASATDDDALERFAEDARTAGCTWSEPGGADAILLHVTHGALADQNRSPDPVDEPRAYQELLVGLVGTDDPAEV